MILLILRSWYSSFYVSSGIVLYLWFYITCKVIDAYYMSTFRKIQLVKYKCLYKQHFAEIFPQNNFLYFLHYNPSHTSIDKKKYANGGLAQFVGNTSFNDIMNDKRMVSKLHWKQALHGLKLGQSRHALSTCYYCYFQLERSKSLYILIDTHFKTIFFYYL